MSWTGVVDVKMMHEKGPHPKLEDYTHEIWNWEKCKAKIMGLRGRLGFPDSLTLSFLGLSLSLKDGTIYDELKKCSYSVVAPRVYCILSGYAEASPIPEASKLISFRQLSGGYAYYGAFSRRAIQPIERVFGFSPERLHEAAGLLGGVRLDYGDYSAKVYALPLVPITIILWGATPEFSPTANILFDSSASNYLSTEQLAMLSELTTARLRHASEVLNSRFKPG